MAEKVVAYLVNQYPSVSHTFIRTEIAALERAGWKVSRFALRGWQATLLDPLDRAEQTRTTYVLQLGVSRLFLALLWEFARHPLRLASAALLAGRCAMSSNRSWLHHAAYLAEACVLNQRLESEGILHVHAHFGSNSTDVAMLAARLGNVTYSFTVHGPEEFDRPLMLHLREKIADAAFVIAISAFCRSQLMRWSDARAWPKLQIVRCALGDAFLALPPPSIGKPLQFVCVGRLCEQKGQLLLVQAMAQLHASGIKAELVLAGDGEMRGEIERAIAHAKLESSVQITGWLTSEGVRNELLRSDALILPSFAEGLPVVIMEAMSLGRLPLSTYVAGIPELVRDGREGILFPAGDASAIVGAIQRFIGLSPGDRRSMEQAARQRVLAFHHPDREARKLAGLLASTVAA